MKELTSDVGELILQGADVGHVDVEEGAELGHDHAYPGDGDVCQATAAVHWQGGRGGRTQKKEQTPDAQHGVDERSDSALTSPASCECHGSVPTNDILAAVLLKWFFKEGICKK